MRNTKLILRHDSTANWNANKNVVLLKGELGLEFLENKQVKIKIGDGETAWDKLGYFCDLAELVDRITKLEERKETVKLGETLVLNCGGAAENETN